MTTWTPATQQTEAWTASTKQAESWAGATQQAETWTGVIPGLHVFSTLVFSHAYLGALRVFALGNPSGGAEVWDRSTIQSEAWTPA